MMIILGSIIVIACVAGGFVLGTGKLLSLWQPTELIIILGAATGAFVISNPLQVVKKSIKNVFDLIFGEKINKDSYLELFSLLFQLGNKVRKSGLLSLELEIDDPNKSKLFTKYPKLLAKEKLIDFLTDSFRIIIGGNLSHFEFEALLDSEIESIEEELEKPIEAVGAVSEALPGFGIVAAVLGIVITMQFIGGDPKILGIKVAAALVGTFLGILFSYGFVGPISIAMHYISKKEIKFFYCVKIFILAFSSGTSPSLAVEYARRILYPEMRPSFLELEEIIKKLKKS